MSDAMTSGWDQLLCPYFTESCRRWIGPHIASYGFIESDVTMIGEPIYRNGKLFVQVGYEPETFPRYSPTIVIGSGQSKFDPQGKSCCVPLWFLIPQGSDERSYSFWTFGSSDELNTVLEKIWNQIIESYVRPLIDEPAFLNSAIARFRQHT